MAILNNIEINALKSFPRATLKFMASYGVPLTFVLSFIMGVIWLNTQIHWNISATRLALKQSELLERQIMISQKPAPEPVTSNTQTEKDLTHTVTMIGDLITLIHQIQGSVKGLTDLDQKESEILSNSLKDLASKQDELTAKQVEITEKLDNIKAVIRRGNLLLPDSER